MNWKLFWRHVLESILIIGCTLGFGLMVLPAIWIHEWWPEMRQGGTTPQEGKG